MTKQQIKELAEAYGWVDMGEQKNPYMISFKHDEDFRRMNVYFTTMTVTIQGENIGMRTYRNVESEKEFEEILLLIA